MIYLFEDGRILYDKSLLTPEDHEKYIELETLPETYPIDGKIGVISGCNLKTGEVYIEYLKVPVCDSVRLDLPESKPIYQPTEIKLALMKTQAAIYEELQATKLFQMKANAEIYEAILSNGGNV